MSKCSDCRHWKPLLCGTGTIGGCIIHGIYTTADSPTCKEFGGLVPETMRIKTAIECRGLLIGIHIGVIEAAQLRNANYQDGDPIWLDISPRESDE